MIYLALGSNLSFEKNMSPEKILAHALILLQEASCEILEVSRIWTSDPWPPILVTQGQGRYYNLVASIKTDLSAAEILRRGHLIEEQFGRLRQVRWGARTLDIDLIDYHGQIRNEEGGLVLPHPRAHERLFVLKPLIEISPSWRHPVSGQSIENLIAELVDQGQGLEPAPLDIQQKFRMTLKQRA